MRRLLEKAPQYLVLSIVGMMNLCDADSTLDLDNICHDSLLPSNLKYRLIAQVRTDGFALVTYVLTGI